MCTQTKKLFLLFFLLTNSLLTQTAQTVVDKGEGADLILTLREQNAMKGELVAVRNEGILFNSKVGEPTAFKWSEIEKIKILKGYTRLLIGGLIGAAIGGTIDLTVERLNYIESREWSVAITPPLGAALGVGVAALFNKDEEVTISNKNEKELAILKNNLKSVSRFPAGEPTFVRSYFEGTSIKQRNNIAVKDNIAPKLIIKSLNSFDATRGMKVVELESSRIKIVGIASDEVGITAVYIGNLEAQLSEATNDEVAQFSLLGKVVKFSGEIFLALGDNQIEIKAIDVNGNVAKQTIVVNRKESKTPIAQQRKLPQVWGVVVGISEYQNTELKLQYAHKDAQSFYGFLKSPNGGGVSDDKIELLTNRNATRSDVIRAINEKLRMAFEDHLVIIYLASHGLPDEVSGEMYFLGYDADVKNLAGTAISQLDIQKAISKSRAKKVVLIADACHSGSIGLSPYMAQRTSPAYYINKLMTEIANSRDGVALLTASSANEFSQEGQEWGGHGVFTNHLINGLKGSADQDTDGYVNIRELYEYVYRKVTDDTKGKQHPELQGKFDNNLPLSVVR